MATTIHNTHPSSLTSQQFLKYFKINPLYSLKCPSKPKFSKLKCNLSNPTKTLLKPLITPSSTTPLHQGKHTLHPFKEEDPLYFGGRWSRTEESCSCRGDMRVWSKRPGSNNKKTRVIVGLECTGCLANRYITEKRRVAREALVLNKYCPKCKKHTDHKEVKIGSSK